MRWFLAIIVSTCVCLPLGAQQCPVAPSKLEVSKGDYLSQPGVVFTLQNFSADMVPKGKSAPQCFVKTTNVEHGRVYVNTDSLTHLFQQKVENGSSSGGEQKNGGQGQAKQDQGKKDSGKDKDKDAKNSGKDQKDSGKDDKGQLSDIAIKANGSELAISGKKKGTMSIPFELSGPLDVVNGHVLRLQVKKIKAAGIESKGLLDLLGVHLTKMLHPDEAKGVTVQDNAILVDTEAIANIKGQISRAQISGNDLVVDFVPEHGNTKKADAHHPAKAGAGRAVAAATPMKKK
jgi:hypothetical protein